jgi:type I restriction enzyme M protein
VLFFDRRPRRVAPWTEALWVYDLRTDQRFTLKERPLRRSNLDEFVRLARLADRGARTETPTVERWKCYSYAELAGRDRFDLNLSWLKTVGATDPSTLPPPAEIAAAIADELEAALAKFRAVATRLAE